ncbi:MAG: cobalamin-independent methionine synthase II family protein [Solirubrobacterales bacterium]
MFTATKDKVLPTTVTGSWPRPAWYDSNTGGERFAHCMTDIEYRESFSDATSCVISDQERAGLDILTNGDYHLDPEFAGRSWLHYPLDRIGGLSPDEFKPPTDELYTYPRGTLLNEIMVQGWMWPRAEQKLSIAKPFDFDRIWEAAQARTQKPAKFGAGAAQTVEELVSIAEETAYTDQRSMVWDMAELINRELRRLADAGCTVIQIEEPAIHAIAAAQPDHPDLEFMIEAFNFEVDGLDNVEVWAHTCWGNPMMQRVYAARSYEPCVEIFMEKLNIDVWTVEAKDNGGEVLPHLAKYKDGGSDVKIALGVVSHRDLIADTPEEVADEIRKGLEYVKPENLILSSDCGFGREGCKRPVALYKAAGIAQGANIVRRELGVPETLVPIAEDPGEILAKSEEG